MSNEKKSIVPGIIFLFIGLWLFIQHLTRFSSLWLKMYPILILLFSCTLIFETVRRQDKGTLFWGTVFFLIGLFYLLRNYRVIPYLFPDEYWPIFLIALGFGFLVLFCFNPWRWAVLFPAGIFLFMGLSLAAHTLYGMAGEWIDRILHYWPVLLIVLGVGLILSEFQKTSK